MLLRHWSHLSATLSVFSCIVLDVAPSFVLYTSTCRAFRNFVAKKGSEVVQTWALASRSGQLAVICVIRPVIRCKKWVIRVIRRLRKENYILFFLILRITRITHFLQRITGRITQITASWPLLLANAHVCTTSLPFSVTKLQYTAQRMCKHV